jgi:hypothetical protein
MSDLHVEMRADGNLVELIADTARGKSWLDAWKMQARAVVERSYPGQPADAPIFLLTSLLPGVLGGARRAGLKIGNTGGLMNRTRNPNKRDLGT